MSKYFNSKIRIGHPYSRREAAALQSVLFNLGCKWFCDPLRYRDEPDMFGIYIDAHGVMTWTRHAREFMDDKRYEMSYACTTNVEIIEPAKYSVFYQGTQYDKFEFEKAIAKLKPVTY